MQSETIGKLAEALSKAQGSMSAAVLDGENGAFKRDGKNTRYATLASIWNACRKPLADNGFAVVQAFRVDENGLLLLVTKLVHTSGEWMVSEYPVTPLKNDPQGFASAVTYARRYTLSSLVGVVADDDDDGNSASGQQAPRQATQNGNGAKPAAQPATAPQNGTEDADKPSDKQQNALHAKGMDLYGSKELWTIKRGKLVKAVTKGRSESANDLTKPEMKKLLDGLDAKIKARDAEDDVPEGSPLDDVPEMAF